MNAGDYVAIKGQSGSKVYVKEVKGNELFIQAAYQEGTIKGKWMHKNKLVPYGDSTGNESPMGGRASNPDNGRSSVPTNHWLNR